MGHFRHDDITGETVAKIWHQLAGVVSLVAAASGVGVFLTGAAGYVWHRWAASQHQSEIERLRSSMDRASPS